MLYSKISIFYGLSFHKSCCFIFKPMNVESRNFQRNKSRKTDIIEFSKNYKINGKFLNLFNQISFPFVEPTTRRTKKTSV